MQIPLDEILCPRVAVKDADIVPVGDEKHGRPKLRFRSAVAATVGQMLQNVVLLTAALVGSWEVDAILAADAGHGLALVDVHAGGVLDEMVATGAGAQLTDGEVGAPISAAAVIGLTLVQIFMRERMM